MTLIQPAPHLVHPFPVFYAWLPAPGLTPLPPSSIDLMPHRHRSAESPTWGGHPSTAAPLSLGILYPFLKMDKAANLKPINARQLLLLPPTDFPTTLSPPSSSCRPPPPPPPPPTPAAGSPPPCRTVTPPFLTRTAPRTRPTITPATSSSTPADSSSPPARDPPPPATQPFLTRRTSPPRCRSPAHHRSSGSSTFPLLGPPNMED
jgi:hypothetical protein